eukprot:scaffold1016_cov258-Pinguiococcus_pyrenoidosus.AAC.5
MYDSSIYPHEANPLDAPRRNPPKEPPEGSVAPLLHRPTRYESPLLVRIERHLLYAAQTAGAPGGDEADLLTGRAHAVGGGRVPDVLVVTTSERVLHGVHGHTTDLGPLVPLHAVLVVCAAGLEHGLVRPAAAGHDANHRPALVGQGLLRPRRQANAAGALVLVLRDDHAVASGGLDEVASVSDVALDVADHGALRQLSQGQDVAHAEVRLLSAEDELPAVHALRAHHELIVLLVLVRVLELDPRQRRSSPRLMKDLLGTRNQAQTDLHEPLDIAGSLGEVQTPQLGGPLAQAGVALEHRALTLTAATYYLTHLATSSGEPKQMGLNQRRLGLWRAKWGEKASDPVESRTFLNIPESRCGES